MYKQKFYSALKDIFVGEEIEGESGFVNLMKIKSSYYDKIKNKLRNKIDELVSNENEEMEIYEKLYTFFESYLNETGTPFFNSTQIHKNIYEKIYSDKDDVSLFWKTKDLYYIKSEHNYSSMEIEKDGFTFSFDPSELEHKQNNTKENIEFYLVEADKENKLLKFKIKYQQNNDYTRLKEIFKINDNRKLQDFLIEDFDNPEEYPEIRLIKNDLDIMNDNLTKTLRRKMLDIRTKNDTVTEQIVVEFTVEGVENIYEYLKRLDFDIREDTLEEVFSLYKRQNKIDYFIHKNPEKFLKEQFKFYLFNYVYDNDISFEGEGLNRTTQLNKLKEIGFDVIKYIARFENELKAIWEKTKFVLNSNYVITLDRLEINVVKEVINSNNIKEQVKEWRELGLVDEEFSPKDVFNSNGNLNNKYKYLPIDTKYLGNLKWSILNQFHQLEDIVEGVIINSDNYQALNTLMFKNEQKIKCVYIDPPYNTGNDDFSYIDKYQDSSWLTMMENRLSLTKRLLSKDGIIFVSINDYEVHRLRFLMDKIFGEQNLIAQLPTITNLKGNNDEYGYAGTHEYILVYAKNKGKDNIKGLPLDKDKLSEYEKDEYGWFKKGANLKATGTNAPREKRPNLFYPIYINPVTKKLSLKKEDNNYVKLLPLTNGKEMSWRWSKDRLEKEMHNIIIEVNKGNISLYKKQRPTKDDVLHTFKPKSIFYKPEYSTTNGTNALKDLFNNRIFPNPKSVDLIKDLVFMGTKRDSWVLDYFAGSGTTAQAVLEQNNEDHLNRKYLLVELGEDCEKVLIPRIKKLMYSKEWKEGKPISETGYSHIFKYYKLEQYEDVLRRAKYKKLDKQLKNYTFMADEKMLDALELDFKDENIKIKFEHLYPDVDIAETLSNLLGKKIKKLNDKRVIFEDGMEIKFDEMTFEKYPFVKSLIWWGENKEDV